MMPKDTLLHLSYAELLALLFITVTISVSLGTVGTLNREFSAITAAFALFLILAIASFLAFRITKSRKFLVLLNLSFLLSLSALSYYFLESGALDGFYLGSILNQSTRYVLEFLILVPLYISAVLCAYFLRTKRYHLGAAMLAALAAMLWIFFLSGYIVSGYRIGDENYLSVLSLNATMHGLNPYAVSFGKELFGAAMGGNILANTITTNNSIISTFDYPALFFLAQAPFYLISGLSIENVATQGLLLQTAVFMLIVLLCIVFSLDKRDILKPKYPLIVFSVVGLFSLNSIVTLLMIALMVISYRFLDSRHAWIPIGLAASMQEELWLPCLFMIAYIFNNHGARRGLYALAGSAAIFLAINGYFIVLGPSAFAKAVFLPASSNILPNGPAFFSSFLLTNYGMLLGSFTSLTILVSAFLLILLLYFNFRPMIFAFSAIPWMFFGHALASYYATFFFLFVVSLYIKDRNGEGYVARISRESGHSAYPTIAALSLALASALFLVYYSHSAYQSGFGISIGNQSLTHQGSMSVYEADLRYGHLQNYSAYLVIYGYGNYTDGQYGLYNQSMLRENSTCNSGRCPVNLNRIVLNSSRSSYRISAIITSNSLTPITYASAELYNGQYVYVAHGVWSH
ncbi:MAG: hypothetical protein KGI00_04440 [Candidatus Micrarchaeota archaeon]|nr:hypothetical protein [Candidatus Micrarchaeota archaeon]